jgi:hypothetical protein
MLDAGESFKGFEGIGNEEVVALPSEGCIVAHVVGCLRGPLDTSGFVLGSKRDAACYAVVLGAVVMY